jgi:hypothetical protein
VDFEYDGAVFRPQAVFCRDGRGIGAFCERLLGGVGRIAVRVVDVFGNAGFAEL